MTVAMETAIEAVVDSGQVGGGGLGWAGRHHN